MAGKLHEMTGSGVVAEEIAGASGVLLGRDRELSELYALVDGIGTRGGALVVRGDAGDRQVGAARGCEGASAEPGRHGRVHDGCAVRGAARLRRPPPAPASTARRPRSPSRPPAARARGVRSGSPKADAPDVFLIGLAALGLVAERAAETPLLFVVEDAHWLDRPSSEVLKFVARRVESDPALLLFAVREGVPSRFDDAGLPELPLAGLDQEASNALLDLGATTLPADVRRRILEAAAGNPLALIELPAAAAELGAPAARSDPLPLTDSARASVRDEADEPRRRRADAAPPRGARRRRPRRAEPSGEDAAGPGRPGACGRRRPRDARGRDDFGSGTR